MKYKVGDRVKIREDLIEGQHYGGAMFIRLMGGVVEIDKILSADVFTTKEHGSWTYNEEMIERKADMTKADLKEGMLVEHRSGTKHIIKEEDFSTTTYVDGFRDDLTHKRQNGCDIVAVYSPVWKRKKEIKEITAAEAFAILKEKYGCDVKIKEDK